MQVLTGKDIIMRTGQKAAKKIACLRKKQTAAGHPSGFCNYVILTHR